MTIRPAITSNKAFLWLAIGTVMLLLILLIAMTQVPQMQWDMVDIAFAGVLIYGTGALFIVLARALPRVRLVWLGLIMLAVTAYIWAEFAVGVFTALGS